MKVIDKFNEPKYGFILINLKNDIYLTDSQKDKFFSYANNTEIKHDIKDNEFENKVNEEYFFLNISPLVGSHHNKMRVLKNKTLTRIMSKSKFYTCLKQTAEIANPHIFSSENDFINSLESGKGELNKRFGYNIMKNILSNFEFGYKMMWSNYIENSNTIDLRKYQEKDKLSCVLGLDDTTIFNTKYLIKHEYNGNKYFPTTFDSGFIKYWQPGGRTIPRKLYRIFHCKENDCEDCTGLKEIVHKPNIVKNIINIEILD